MKGRDTPVTMDARASGEVVLPVPKGSPGGGADRMRVLAESPPAELGPTSGPPGGLVGNVVDHLGRPVPARIVVRDESQAAVEEVRSTRPADGWPGSRFEV